jgi:hypothetical protein
MAGLLRYGKHRGRALSLQESGWSSRGDLSACMRVPEWVCMSIAHGSYDYKGFPRFMVRSEGATDYIRPFFYQGSKVRNQQQNGW